MKIIEISPVWAHAADPEFVAIHGAWNSHETTEQYSLSRGHQYAYPATAEVRIEDLELLLADADAVIIAPAQAGLNKVMLPPPLDGVAAGRALGHKLIDTVARVRPDVHVVLVSHFLVGHGARHRNGSAGTWGLRALEAHLRASPLKWTILRPTWLSTIHDQSYRIRLSADRLADGLSSTYSIAAAAVTAFENPISSHGRTAAVFNLSIPSTTSDEQAGLQQDLAEQFAQLESDFEAAGVA